MTLEEPEQEAYTQEDHQVAYIFDPEDDGTQKKSVKRKRVSRQAQKDEESIKDSSSSFVPLLNGAEKPEFVHLRETLFEESWTKVDKRIQETLRNSNLETLHEVSDFVNDAVTDS
jgi:origin recognition complex subunit 3